MSSELNQNNKQLVWNFWDRLEAAADADATAVCAAHMIEDMPW